MPRRYFTNFPSIDYNGFTIKNLTVAASVVNKYVNLPYVYDQYDVIDGERVDQVSNKTYDDSYMSWIVFYANKIVDPYYQWFLSDNDFHNFLIKKYSSVEKTIRTVLEFRNNWFNDNRELTPNQFDSMFGEYPGVHSKYWDTNYSEDGILMSYVRKVSDDVVVTNKIIKLQVSSQTLNSGDLVDIKTALNATTRGTAEVLKTDGDFVFLKNVIGDIANTNYLVSDENFTQITAYSASSDYTNDVWTTINISEEEYIYWFPYTVYDMEREKNDNNKLVKLIDPQMAVKLANNLEDELNEREL